MSNCTVFGCNSHWRAHKERKFFRIPSVLTHQGEKMKQLSEKRRAAWISNIGRKNYAVTNGTRICDLHFITGKPASIMEVNHPDWTPTLNMGQQLGSTSKSSFQRYQRLCARNKIKKRKRFEGIREETENSGTSQATSSQLAARTNFLTDAQGEQGCSLPPVVSSEEAWQVVEHSSFYTEHREVPSYDSSVDPSNSAIQTQSVCTETLTEEINQSIEVQTDLGGDEIAHMKYQIRKLTKEVEELSALSDSYRISENFSVRNQDADEKASFYCGLPTYALLLTLFNILKEYVPPIRKKPALTLFQQFVLVLMKLRLNLPEQDLAYRFNIHVSSVSRYLAKWIELMYIVLCPTFINWPDREALRKSLPICFRKSFPDCVAIIDCFEIFTDRAANLNARATTYSSYKSHNTIKFLIAIAPQGAITFISSAYGGRSSDQFITENSRFLDKLVPGDLVLADRGFNVEESIVMLRAKLLTPSFTAGKLQLEKQEVESSRSLSSVRIHVERVIGTLKEKFTILKGTVDSKLLMYDDVQTVPLFEKMVHVCCALLNCCPSVVPFE